MGIRVVVQPLTGYLSLMTILELARPLCWHGPCDGIVDGCWCAERIDWSSILVVLGSIIWLVVRVSTVYRRCWHRLSRLSHSSYQAALELYRHIMWISIQRALAGGRQYVATRKRIHRLFALNANITSIHSRTRLYSGNGHLGRQIFNEGERIDPFRGESLVIVRVKSVRMMKTYYSQKPYEQCRCSISGRRSGTFDAALLAWPWLVDHQQRWKQSLSSWTSRAKATCGQDFVAELRKNRQRLATHESVGF